MWRPCDVSTAPSLPRSVSLPLCVSPSVWIRGFTVNGQISEFENDVCYGKMPLECRWISHGISDTVTSSDMSTCRTAGTITRSRLEMHRATHDKVLNVCKPDALLHDASQTFDPATHGRSSTNRLTTPTGPCLFQLSGCALWNHKEEGCG